MDGFGYALTGGSAMLLHPWTLPSAPRCSTNSSPPRRRHRRQLSPGQHRLVGPERRAFSYDDLPEGQTDPALQHFYLEPTRTGVIPVLKEILAISPGIKILGSPWSAPVWMKTNGNIQGGLLKAGDYKAYAAYFVKYIRAWPPKESPSTPSPSRTSPSTTGTRPSMQMPDWRRTLHRARSRPGVPEGRHKTKIILYDHNRDAPAYPVSILTDPDARKYVDGSGFHLYGGNRDAISEVHDRFPDKNIYFTEQAVGTPPGHQPERGRRVPGPYRRDAQLEPQRHPVEPRRRFGAGRTPTTAAAVCQGALTIDGDKVARKVAYYVIAHASRFVPPGSVRIESSEPP